MLNYSLIVNNTEGLCMSYSNHPVTSELLGFFSTFFRAYAFYSPVPKARLKATKPSFLTTSFMPLKVKQCQQSNTVTGNRPEASVIHSGEIFFSSSSESLLTSSQAEAIFVQSAREQFIKPVTVKSSCITSLH